MIASEDRGKWARATRHAPAWAISAGLHVLILVIFAMITWAVVETRPVDRIVTLSEEEAAVEGGGEGGPRGGSESPEAQSAVAPGAAELPPLPEAPAVAIPLDAAGLTAPPERLTELLSGKADAVSALTASLAAGGAFGDGGGRYPGVGPGLGRLIGGLRKTGLDVVLVLDATDSMAPYIDQAKKRLQEVIKVVAHLVPDSRFGVVAYKDYGDEYPKAVKVLKLSPDRAAVGKFIDEITASGGGDLPEPIHQALSVLVDVKGMGWGPGRKWTVVLVGDSPVHSGGRDAAFESAATFAGKLRGTINVIDVGGAGGGGESRKTVQPDLARIAQAGGGEAFLLKDRQAFWRHLIVSVFGQRYEKEIGTILEVLLEEK